MILITNNPQVKGLKKMIPNSRVEVIGGSAQDVLLEARRRVHQKWRFLADPGAGRDKHRVNPYLTVWMTGPEDHLHLDSLTWVEHLILKDQRTVKADYDKTWLQDFQRLDAELVWLTCHNLLEGSETID